MHNHPQVKRPEKEEPAGPGGFIDSWVKIADQAVEITRLRTQGLSFEEQCEDCEQSSIDVSLRNLMTFPLCAAAPAGGDCCHFSSSSAAHARAAAADNAPDDHSGSVLLFLKCSGCCGRESA